MLHRDELDQPTVNFWTDNFNQESGNIYQQFQELNIQIGSETFTELSHQDTTHIRIYMGLDNGIPKLIAVPAYALDSTETVSVSYADMFIGKKVFDLTNNGVQVDTITAKQWTQSWYDTNKNNELYKTAFLFPRADFIQLFERDEAQSVSIDFGIEKQIKPMVKKVGTQTPDSGEITGVYDFATPCPPVCDLFSLIKPDETE